MSKSDKIVATEEKLNECKTSKCSCKKNTCETAEQGEKKYRVGENCFTKDELVKMGCLYILILVIAFLL